MSLGKTEKLHFKCEHEEDTNNCPKECAKCGIFYKKEGDKSYALGNNSQAEKQYKKALFLEPSYAEAWLCLANTYRNKYEYNNAILAFNKALAIDPEYGNAMFGKAITLRDIGKTYDSMKLVNEILDLYEDKTVSEFKEKLIKSGVGDIQNDYLLETAIEKIRKKTDDIIASNSLSDEEKDDSRSILSFEENNCFIGPLFSYCRNFYKSLGNKKVWSEAILMAYYGAAYFQWVILHAPYPEDFDTTFEYLKNTLNIEELDRALEKAFDIQNEENRTEKIWNIIYSFVSFSIPIITKIHPISDAETAVLKAIENACKIGTLLAIRQYDQESLSQQLSMLDIVDNSKETEERGESYYSPPERSAMCYSPRHYNG